MKLHQRRKLGEDGKTERLWNLKVCLIPLSLSLSLGFSFALFSPPLSISFYPSSSDGGKEKMP